jgi:predicted MFS family arabinose efflux permease
MKHLSADVKQYGVITANYWLFTLTDGALRMLVVLHFHQLGYSPLEIAALFVFYEFFGVVTNLLGGYLGARIGLNHTMNLGLVLQMLALLMLAVPAAYLTVPWVMAAQAMSGIAKDLNKMSAKSSLKLLVAEEQQGQLFKWVALLTGSKNALKGVGFFLGGLLLTTIGFAPAVMVMAALLALTWLASLFLLRRDFGKTRVKPKFRNLFSKSRNINILSAARLFLFGARDIWFVVALPVFLSNQLGWDFWKVGGFLALWVIGYGVVQSLTPTLFRRTPSGRAAVGWALGLALIPPLIASAMPVLPSQVTLVLIVGLACFAVAFAVNSSLHSYLIVSFAQRDGVSLDVGFYYMANAAGRLAGTLLSGWAYQSGGLELCLWISGLMIFLAALLSIGLPQHHAPLPSSATPES